jgi:hypothetical protein
MFNLCHIFLNNDNNVQGSNYHGPGVSHIG